MNALRTVLFCACLVVLPARPQTNDSSRKPDPPPAMPSASTNRISHPRSVEAIRADCIQSRRIICGKILKVLPDGLVVDSGYTSLRRQSLERSWLIPSTVEAEREPNLVEKNEPDCVCVGLVFLTDAPKSGRARPKVLDYVVLEGFPAGQFTYNSVGTVQRTVRKFSANLPAAVQSNLKAEP